MFTGFLNRTCCPIGIDMDGDSIKMVQLRADSKGTSIVCSGMEQVPCDIEIGSSDWQRWAIDVIKRIVSQSSFETKQAVTAIPSRDVFVELMSIDKMPEDKIRQHVLIKVGQKAGFDVNNAMVQYSMINGNGMNGSRQMDILVTATEKVKVDRYLAIYEKANLTLKGITVWPMALTSSYLKFFGRRNSDVNVSVMLLNISSDHSNIIINKHRNILFARTVPIGSKDFDDQNSRDKLIFELEASRRYFESSRKMQIKRLILMSNENEKICQSLSIFAQQNEIIAQVGNVLEAVTVENNMHGTDKITNPTDWATAFGLSLS